MLHTCRDGIPYYSATFWQGKTLANRSFQCFGKENVGENLELSWVEYCGE